MACNCFQLLNSIVATCQANISLAAVVLYAALDVIKEGELYKVGGFIDINKYIEASGLLKVLSSGSKSSVQKHKQVLQGYKVSNSPPSHNSTICTKLLLLIMCNMAINDSDITHEGH